MLPAALSTCCDAALGLASPEPRAPDSSEPAAGPYWSLMFEISESKYKPVSMEPTKLGGTAGTW